MPQSIIQEPTCAVLKSGTISLLWLSAAFNFVSFHVSLATEQPYHPTSYTHYIRGQNQIPPVWIVPGKISNNLNTLTFLDYKLIPFDEISSLAITFLYDDSTESNNFIRVIWRGQTRSILLSNNIKQGTGFLNTATLLVGAEDLTGPGDLIIQTSTKNLGIHAINFAWHKVRNILASSQAPEKNLLITDYGEVLRLHPSLNDHQSLGDQLISDDIHGDTITLKLLDEPVTERGAENFFELSFSEQIPAIVRLAFEVISPDSCTQIDVYVNNRKTGSVAIAAPDLREFAYQWTLIGSDLNRAHLNYVGWRQATFLIAECHLKPGTNVIHFVPIRKDVGGSNNLVTLKNFTAQLKYRPITADFSEENLISSELSTKTNFRQESDNEQNTIDNELEYLPLPRSEPIPELRQVLEPSPIKLGPPHDSPTWYSVSLVGNTG